VYTGVFSASDTTSTPTSDPKPKYGYSYQQYYYPRPVWIQEKDYAGAGEIMTILIDINWLNDDYPAMAKAFTVSVYAKQSF